MKNSIEQFPILHDVQIYLEYCAKNKPKVTKARGHLNRKSLYELNQQIHHSQSDAHSKSDQPTYIALTFYYHLALNGKLLEFDYSKKTTTKIKASDNFRFFADLPPIAQYFYLVKTYWLYCDWEEIMPKDRSRIFSKGIDDFFAALLQHPAEQPIAYDQHRMLSYQAWHINAHHFYLQYLGWLSNIQFSKEGGFYNFNGVTMTTLGKELLTILTEKATYSLWNAAAAKEEYAIDPFQLFFAEEEEEEEDVLELPNVEVLQNMTEEERNAAIQNVYQQMQQMVGDSVDIPQFMAEMKTQSEQGTLTPESMMQQLAERMEAAEPEVKAAKFEHFFVDYFGAAVPHLEIEAEAEMVAGHYTFKITSPYHTKFWRTVKVDAQHTLHDLHLIIQRAINFDNDHLYSFYMDNKSRSKFGYHSPFGMQRPLTTEVQIGELSWREGQRILYLFDYGDDWEFTVEMVKHETVDAPLELPIVVDSKGDAPEQYPDW